MGYEYADDRRAKCRGLMFRALMLSAALVACTAATAQSKKPYPFEGSWTCGGMTFKFTGRTYDQGSGPSRFQRVQVVKAGDYRLIFPKNYAISLRVLSPTEMRWLSEETGDSFFCNREVADDAEAIKTITSPIVTASDAAALLDKILASSPEKSQFETTVAYEARKKQAVEALYQSPAAKGAWYDLVDPRHMRYDADAGAVKFYSHLLTGATLSRVETVEGQYEGANAYGAKANVTRRNEVVKRLEWEASADTEMMIPLSVALAQPQWNDLRILVQGSISPRPIERSQYRTSPKFDSPYEDDVTTYKMGFRPARIAIYNQATKAVLVNLPLVSCREEFMPTKLKAGRC